MAESLFKEVFNMLASHICILNEHGDIIEVNEAWRTFAHDNNAAPEAYLGSNYLEICQQASQEGDAEAQHCYEGLSEVIAGTRSHFRLEYPCHSATQERWFQLDAKALNDGKHFLVSHHDISAKRQSETTLSHYSQFQEALLDTVNQLWRAPHDGSLYQRLLDYAVNLIPAAQTGSVLVRKSDGRYHYVAAKGYEFSTLETISYAENELYFGTDARQLSYLTYNLASFDKEKLSHETYQLLLKSGSIAQIKVALALPIRHNERVIAFMSLENNERATAFDEEARRMAEVFAAGVGLALQQQLDLEVAHQREQRLALLFKQTPLGVIEWDVNGKVNAWNPAAETIFGYKAEEVIGQRTTSFIVPDWVTPHTDKTWAALVSNTGGQRSTNENITKDRRIITCDWYNSTLLDETGKVIGVASLVQDVSDRKRTEEQLSQAIQEVLQDTTWFTQLVMEKLAKIKNGSNYDHLGELSERERQVLELIAKGVNNKEIGRQLQLSAQTVRNYVSHIYSKLNVRSRAEAVVWARERGII